MSNQNQYAPMRINTAIMHREIIEIHHLVHSSNKDENLVNPTSSTYIWLKDISFDDLVLHKLPEILKELTIGFKKIRNLEKSRDLNIFDRLLDAVEMPKLDQPNSIEQLKKLLPVFFEHYADAMLNGRNVFWNFFDIMDNNITQRFFLVMKSLVIEDDTPIVPCKSITLIRNPSLVVHLLA